MHEHTPLAKPAFCSGGRISCKPNTGALPSISTNKNDDSRNPNYCALLGTRTTSKDDSKRFGAGVDILELPLAAIRIIFIVQLVVNVPIKATTVLSIIIRIRTVKLGRVIVTATVIDIVVIMARIMIVILIVLVAVMVLNLILVKKNESSDSSGSNSNSSSNTNNKNL